MFNGIAILQISFLKIKYFSEIVFFSLVHTVTTAKTYPVPSSLDLYHDYEHLIKELRGLEKRSVYQVLSCK